MLMKSKLNTSKSPDWVDTNSAQSLGFPWVISGEQLVLWDAKFAQDFGSAGDVSA